MGTNAVSQNVIRNTKSNYVLVVSRVALGLITFRLLFDRLTDEQFGFWALLWSIFGFGALLDFGFGLSVQKNVAQRSHTQDWSGLNTVLSTILMLYFGIGAAVMVAAWLVAGPVLELVNISSENLGEFRGVFIMFGLAMALSLPLSVFSEALRGRQVIWRVNQWTLIGLALNFVLLIAAVTWNWSFYTIAANALLCLVCPNIALIFFAFREIPQLRLSPWLFSRKMMAETSKFSGITYLVMVSYMLLTKTDQLVIGGMLSAAAIAIYQPGSKLGEMFGFATRQLAATLQPAAAHLQAAGDREGLRKLLVGGTRYSVLLATPLYLGFAFLLKPGLRLLTGLENPSPETLWTAQILIFWSYFFIFTHNVYKRIAVMCGHEKRLMWVGLGEAAMNLGLSILFVHLFDNVVGVAAATAIASMFFAVAFLWRWSCHEAEMSGLAFAKETLFGNWLGCGPLLVWLSFARWNPWFQYEDSYWLSAVVALVGMVVGVWGIWRLALRAEERAVASAKLARVTRRFGFGS